MRVAVFGANPKKENIGWAIAQRLTKDGHNVETNSPSWNGARPSQAVFDGTAVGATGFDRIPTEALVLANGIMEPANIGEITGQSHYYNVMTSTLVESMIGVNNFVADRGPVPDGEQRRKIVLIGSMAHTKVLTGYSAYCAAKAGLAMYARCAAWELGPKGYDVFLINPGNVIDTPIADLLINNLIRDRGMTPDEALAHYSAGQNPVHKADIASTVAWLLTNEATHLSGAAIDIHGGGR